MKKISAVVIAIVMLLTFAACKGKGENEITSNVTQESSEAQKTTGTVVDDGMNVPAPDASEPPSDNGNTAAQTLLNVFHTEIQNNPTATAEELANKVVSHESIKFAPVVMPAEEGYLAGFKNEIKGFKEAVTFAPGIGTIPFVGYIFKLSDGADVEAFKATLESEADLRWNICTAAEEIVCESVGNTVFFLMCPVSLDG